MEYKSQVYYYEFESIEDELFVINFFSLFNLLVLFSSFPSFSFVLSKAVRLLRQHPIMLLLCHSSSCGFLKMCVNVSVRVYGNFICIDVDKSVYLFVCLSMYVLALPLLLLNLLVTAWERWKSF